MYSNELIIDILKYIDNNINKKITMEELSKQFYFNKDYIMRLFKKELNLTIMDYINKKRIYNSLKELRTTNNSILKIALNNGFQSQQYYSEMFTKIIGTSPNTYKKSLKLNTPIKEEEINIIRINLAYLIKTIQYIDIYKTNIKKEEIKKLSLFN